MRTTTALRVRVTSEFPFPFPFPFQFPFPFPLFLVLPFLYVKQEATKKQQCARGGTNKRRQTPFSVVA